MSSSHAYSGQTDHLVRNSLTTAYQFSGVSITDMAALLRAKTGRLRLFSKFTQSTQSGNTLDWIRCLIADIQAWAAILAGWTAGVRRKQTTTNTRFRHTYKQSNPGASLGGINQPVRRFARDHLRKKKMCRRDGVLHGRDTNCAV